MLLDYLKLTLKQALYAILFVILLQIITRVPELYLNPPPLPQNEPKYRSSEARQLKRAGT